MTPRNTRTGGVLEAMILPALAHGGYEATAQGHVGQRLGTGAHNVDAIAKKNGRKHLVSLKWQQTSGTAEQKVPFVKSASQQGCSASYHFTEGASRFILSVGNRVGAVFQGPVGASARPWVRQRPRSVP
jgi:hypothetical protein